jgi:hypothetical protein
MIIEIFILLQVFTIILFLIAWYKQEPMMWVMAFIFSSINIFTSYNVEYVVMTFSKGVLAQNIISISYPVVSYINMIFLAASIIMFFWDIYNPQNEVLARGD